MGLCSSYMDSPSLLGDCAHDVAQRELFLAGPFRATQNSSFQCSPPFIYIFCVCMYVYVYMYMYVCMYICSDWYSTNLIEYVFCFLLLCVPHCLFIIFVCVCSSQLFFATPSYFFSAVVSSRSSTMIKMALDKYLGQLPS